MGTELWPYGCHQVKIYFTGNSFLCIHHSAQWNIHMWIVEYTGQIKEHWDTGGLEHPTFDL